MDQTETTNPAAPRKKLRTRTLLLAIGMSFALAFTLGLGVLGRGWADRGAEERAHRLLATASRAAYTAVMGANDFVSTRAASDKEIYGVAMGQLASTLSSVAEIDTATGDRVDALRKNIARLDELAAELWSGESLELRISTMREFDARAETVLDEIHGIDRALALQAARWRTIETITLTAAWALGLGLVVLVLVMLSHWRWRAEVERESLDTAIGSAAEVVDGLACGDESAPISDHERLVPLARSLGRARVDVRHLLDRADASQRWASYTSELEALLDLAESEPAVLRAIERAVGFAFGEVELQVLLADNSHSRLEPRRAAGPTLCTPGSPMECPAVRRNLIEENGAEPRLSRCPHLPERECHVTCAFLAINGRSAGALQIVSPARLEDNRELLRHLAIAAGNRLSIVRVLEEREVQASTDALTGLANRRMMGRRLAELDRQRAPYAVVSCDLDHFKRLNDSFGHETGDRCLRIFAQVLRDCCRDSDLACRPGGEEFLMVLAGCGLASALQVAERVRAGTVEASRKAGVEFTVSLGVACHPLHGIDGEGVLRAADEALYRAKDEGRNRAAHPGRLSAVPPGVLEEPAAASRDTAA